MIELVCNFTINSGLEMVEMYDRIVLEWFNIRFWQNCLDII